MQTEIKSPSGKMFNLSPLTIEDIISLKSYCQYMAWHTLYSQRDTFPEEYVKPELERLFLECAKKVVTERNIDEWVSTLEGARELLWLSLKRNHDNLTKTEVGEMLTIANFQDIVKRLLVLSGMWEEAAKKKTPAGTRKPSK